MPHPLLTPAGRIVAQGIDEDGFVTAARDLARPATHVAVDLPGVLPGTPGTRMIAELENATLIRPDWVRALDEAPAPAEDAVVRRLRRGQPSRLFLALAGALLGAACGVVVALVLLGEGVQR